jgi:predicted nucleotidyltransferase component of viral defense system
MNAAPNQQFIEDLAIELGTKSAYLEKDWYAVQLLKHICDSQADLNCDLVFTGGTSLSKGYKMLDRFSEDIDLLVLDSAEHNKTSRSSFKRALVDLVDSHQTFTYVKDSLKASDKNRSFEFLVKYPSMFPSSKIREGLKVDVRFLNPHLPTVDNQITSTVSQYQKASAELSTSCVSPIEIAGDKLSALAWKLHNLEKYEPPVIRHLHDLAWLKEIISDDPESFKESVEQSFQNDESRWPNDLKHFSMKDKIQSTIKFLEEDKVFSEDYMNYVLEFSYSKDDDKISYADSIKALREISALF